jgi:hypothetical protein
VTFPGWSPSAFHFFDEPWADDDRAWSLARTILEQGADHPWTMQGIGLMALRLDDQRIHRLHVWDPERSVGEPPIHDHPYDFTSIVVAGTLTNTRYTEDSTGDTYRRERYSLPVESTRRTDHVNLVGTSTVHGAGARYHQLAHELHDSRQVAGTVTIIRCVWHDPAELTVCLRPEAPWVSGQSRPATASEVERITAQALDQLLASA